MPATIRDKIIEHLSFTQSAGVTALAAALGVTKADIRYHLKSLINEQLVEKDENQTIFVSRERGRPGAAFRLTANARGTNYQLLAAALLRGYFVDHPESAAEAAAADLASVVFTIPEEYNGTLIQGLNQMITELRSHNYAPHWEAHSGGPVVFFENCPYAAIWGDFPQLCEMDRHLIIKSTNLPVNLLQVIHFSNRKPPACIFKINPQSF